MGKFIRSKEAALRWNLSERRVSGMCKTGTIPGAVKQGKQWMIPSDAERPADRRVKTGAYSSVNNDRTRLPLPVGVSDYRLASSEYYYVDKTMILKEFIDERPAVTLFTRPRRFGKTLNMDMIRTFFEKTNEDTSKYFVNKKIWAQGEKYRSYQGKYPVIFITLKDVKHTSWLKTRENISSIISMEYNRHSELSESPNLDNKQIEFYKKMISNQCSDVELEKSLMLLSEMLHRHYGEAAVVIIDEYDTPIQSGYSNGFYDDAIAFMRNLLSGCFKDNKHLAFGFLTGILRVAKESIFSGLNNLTINSVLDNKYSEYFGFTESEVQKMAKYYGASDRIDEIREWYDGYRFGRTDIFNPWSVINYFSNRCEPKAYWVSTGSNDVITEILSEADDEMYQKLTSLVNGETITTYVDTSVIYPQVKSNPASVYSFLLVAGYLKSIRTSESVVGDSIVELSLPNKEVAFVYRKEILRKLERIITQPLAVEIEKALFAADGDMLRIVLEKFLIQTVSSFDTMNENFYHGFLLGICTLFGSFYLTSNRESGEGRYDIQLEPRKRELPGIIIELKAEKNCSEKQLNALAETALKQIEDKKYDTEMKSKGVTTILKYGVAFSGKKVEVSAFQMPV